MNIKGNAIEKPEYLGLHINVLDQDLFDIEFHPQ